MTMYLLTCHECNGESCETVHHSLHSSVEKAKENFRRLLDPQLLTCEGASNEWKPSMKGDTQEIQVGMWGYVSWQIRPLEPDPVEFRLKTTLKCRKCEKSGIFIHLPQQDLLWEAFKFEEEHMDCATALNVSSREELFEKVSEPIPASLIGPASRPASDLC